MDKAYTERQTPSLKEKVEKRRGSFLRMGLVGKIEKNYNLKLEKHTDQTSGWDFHHIFWKRKKTGILRRMGVGVNIKEKRVGIAINDNLRGNVEFHFPLNSEKEIMDIIKLRDWPLKKLVLFIARKKAAKKLFLNGTKFPRKGF